MVYQNVSKEDLIIPNVGLVKAGETITSAEKLENPNLKEVQAVPPKVEQPAVQTTK